MRLTHPQKGPRCLPQCHRAPAFVISQSGFLMALPAAGSSQGSDMPTPPPRWCGAGGPHTGGSRDGRGLSGTEGQEDGSTTKRFMRLDQGPPPPRQRWGRGHRWRRAERTPAPGREAGKEGVSRRQEEQQGAKGATGASAASPPGRPASCSGRVHVPAWLGAAGRTPGRRAAARAHPSPAQTAERRCSGPARRNWLPLFLCSRGGCCP